MLNGRFPPVAYVNDWRAERGMVVSRMWWKLEGGVISG
jgi:hypothetical protein